MGARKFSGQQILAIRRMGEGGLNSNQIASIYGCNESSIRSILRHETYKDVTEEKVAYFSRFSKNMIL